MPYKKKYGKRGKKKMASSYRRRRNRRSSKLPVLGGFPTSKKVRLRYACTVSLNPGAGQVVKAQYSANGMYDPEQSSGGSQPRFYDQLMSYYNHYSVIGSKITIKPCGPLATNAAATIQYGITLSPDSTFPWTTWKDLAESRHAGMGTARAADIASSRAVTKTFSAKKYFGAQAIVGASQYEGTVTSNPAEIANFQVWACNCEGSDNPQETVFTVIIDYIAVLTEPKYVGAS